MMCARYAKHVAGGRLAHVRGGDTARQQGFIMGSAVVEVLHYLPSDSRYSRKRRTWEEAA